MAKTMYTGVTLRDTALEWTLLRQRQERTEVAQHERTILELPEGVTDPKAPEATPVLKAACAAMKGQVILALPTDQVLLRVVDLPSIDVEELQGMVELQVDKFSPFPIEQMAVSFEVLREGEDSSRVLIAAAQRDLVTSLGGAFYAAGRPPQRMDVEVLGWWHLLQTHGHVVEKGRHILLILDGPSVELIIAQDGNPVVFRSLGGHGDVSVEAFATEIAEETSYTLTTLEADWGAGETARFSLWHEKPPSEELLARLREECGMEIEHAGLDTLPPLSEGLARRALERTGPVTDLSPAEWHAEERARQTQRKILVATAVLLGVWALGIAVFMIVLHLQSSKLTGMRTRVNQVEQPAEEVRLVMQKVKELEQYADRTYSAIECLREISVLLPRGVDLGSFVFKKTREVTLRGETSPSSVNLIYDFFEGLEKSELFIGIENEQVTTRTSGARRTAQFSVTATLPGQEEEES